MIAGAGFAKDTKKVIFYELPILHQNIILLDLAQRLDNFYFFLWYLRSVVFVIFL